MSFFFVVHASTHKYIKISPESIILNQIEHSIGSLGHKLNEKGVQDVTIRKVTFRGTDNGLRIKTWGRPSRGYVKKVVFEDSKMINVRYPIIINQNYCPTKKGCPNKVCKRFPYQHIFFTNIGLIKNLILIPSNILGGGI